MNAEIIAVGTELLMGQIANTNAQFISQRLNSIGINVYYHSVVGDNSNRLKDTLNTALNRSDLVILTGGLGPTEDDITKETVSEFLNKKLITHDESLTNIKDFFKRINREMPESNLKQALVMEDSQVVPNDKGTAPGVIIEHDNKIIVILPGPPSEMNVMFDNTVLPYLLDKSDRKIHSVFLKLFGIGESSVEYKLKDLILKQSNPTIATYVKESEVVIRVTASSSKSEDATELLSPVISEINNRLSEYIYSSDNLEMEEEVAKLLLSKNTTLATAESCTGGMIAGRITRVPGVSSSFLRGFVTYSNEAKMENLGVKPETLDAFGAVSEETAHEMALGAKNVSGTDLGLSVTGIAGPGGATETKPVGLVYVALAHQNGVLCQKLNLTGDRDRIRNVTTLTALDMVRKHLLSID